MQDNNVLVINCGSSSIKFALIAPTSGRRLIGGLAERLGSSQARIVWQTETDGASTPIANADHAHAMEAIVGLPAAQVLLATAPLAIGHRVVHGGERFAESTIVDDEVLAAIAACSSLAPLHNPANILGIETAQALFPTLPQVAVFDTAFHQTIPAHAYLYATPYEWYEKLGVRRYGFHGTSHRFVTQRATELLGLPVGSGAFISAHLGNGCSAAAVSNGRSLDTTMGLTPLEGLMMGTRSGDVDPALHQFLADQAQLSLDDVTAALNKHSGLLGVSGVSNDMRAVAAAAAAGNPRARLAIDVFCYRLARGLAALAVALDTLDALIFTGGIGENDANVRARCVAHLRLLGFTVDAALNSAHGRNSAGQIAGAASRTILVIPTDEEWMIAQDCARLVG